MTISKRPYRGMKVVHNNGQVATVKTVQDKPQAIVAVKYTTHATIEWYTFSEFSRFFNEVGDE